MSSGEQVKLCTWADLSLADTQELIKCSQNRDDLKQALCKKLRLEIECAEDISTCKLKQNLIEADLFTYAFLFGLEEKYSPAQLSTLITIIKNVHALCVSSMFDNHSDALSYFQKLVIQHSVSRPPFSVQIFNPNEVKNLNEYVLSTYFKHYKLYKYAFTRRVHLNISLAYTGEEPEIKTENKETDVSAQGSTSEQEDRENEVEPLSITQTEAASSRIKDLINADLTKMVQQEQERLQSQLTAQESRLVGRIAILEASIDPKRPATNSGKKKSKTTH